MDSRESLLPLGGSLEGYSVGTSLQAAMFERSQMVPVRYRPNAARSKVKQYMCACATSAIRHLMHSSGRGLAV